MKMLGLGALRESEVLDFRQRDGENMKKAWDRISEPHKRIMPWIPIKIVLRNFYHGLFKWCKELQRVFSHKRIALVEKQPKMFLLLFLVVLMIVTTVSTSLYLYFQPLCQVIASYDVGSKSC